MNIKLQLPESFEKEEKDEREWESIIAPHVKLLKILRVAKIVIIVIGVLLCVLLAAAGNGTTEGIIVPVVIFAIIFGGIVLLCYIGELHINAQINHLAIEYQQRNLLKKSVTKDTVK